MTGNYYARGRYHGRYPRDWTLQVQRGDPYGAPWSSGVLWPSPDRYLLTVLLTPAEVQELMRVRAARSECLSFRHRYTDGLIEVSGIELSAEEAAEFAQRGPAGGNPLERLLGGPWPECGYRLVAVPDPLLG